MTSTSDSSSEEVGKTYYLGLFSQRCNGFIGAKEAAFVVKIEIPVERYYPRLKNIYPGEVDEDIIVLSKIVEGTSLIELKRINLSEIELADLRVIKQKDIGKLSKKKHDDDYEDETGAQIMSQLPSDVEIVLEYSSSLELVFVKQENHILLRTVIVTNSDILA